MTPDISGLGDKGRARLAVAVRYIAVSAFMVAAWCVFATFPLRHLYSVLRWSVMLCCVALGVAFFMTRRHKTVAFTLALLIVFNPIFPIPLPRAIWILLDLAGAAALLVLGMFVACVVDTRDGDGL